MFYIFPLTYSLSSFFLLLFPHLKVSWVFLCQSVFCSYLLRSCLLPLVFLFFFFFHTCVDICFGADKHVDPADCFKLSMRVIVVFWPLTRQKMPFRVMHRKDVTHSNGSYERKSRGRKLADEVKNSHGTLID